MKTTIFKHSFAVAALTFATVSAYAGEFTTIASNGARTAGGSRVLADDKFYLGLTSLPSAWTLQDARTTTVYSSVSGYTNQAVGSFIDSVWLDSSTNSYIIGSYFQLNNSTNGITEINSIVRGGFADYTGNISAGYIFANYVYPTTAPAAGYRLNNPARSDYVASYNATTANNGGYFNSDKVAIGTDVSLGEGNPNSALYLLKISNADQYTVDWTVDAVRIVQGASSCSGSGECRLFADMKISGFAVTAVPEAQTYAMMMAGLAMIGSIVRRRKSA